MSRIKRSADESAKYTPTAATPDNRNKPELKPALASKATAIHTGLTKEDIQQSFLDHLLCTLGRAPLTATPNDVYIALALAVRDRVFSHAVRTIESCIGDDARIVSYLSAEYLPGPHLANNLYSLGITDQTRDAMAALGADLDRILQQEEEPGLGNGGLGRLASCFMDSLASIGVPAVGYGIRYEFGIFDQTISDGAQVEVTDKWLRLGNPWEIARPELACTVRFGGRTETRTDENGNYHACWIPDIVVKGVPYDTPVLGYESKECNTLRLWKAEAVESFDFAAFNHGDYYRAVEDKMFSENITKVLYPNDEVIQGKTLRLQQQYFFVTCSLKDMIRMHLWLKRPIETFHTKWAVQLNDTHPAVAVVELMRLLVDKYRVDWDAAWNITRNTFSYTNHTLLPEALEKWSLPLFGSLLPRHLEIICEINRRFLDEVRERFPGDEDRVQRMSLIDETGERHVRMAHLAVVGSHRVNGVARLHSELLVKTVLHDFAELWPDKFCNVTNGVTPRRFMALSNPPLAHLLSDRLGNEWPTDLNRLRELEPLADNMQFHQEWRKAKLTAKQALAAIIEQRVGCTVDPASLFDVQVKRIHEYKRQHLNLLHILTMYLRLKRNPNSEVPARTFIFGGKAAPGYYMAKLIIRLCNAIARTVNNDNTIKGRIKVVFFPDFNVKNAQWVYPAADLSEQISTAGKEASGTGNMKFSLNGALTIGTLDGANVEIREEVGAENFFLFGMDVDQVQQLKAKGYRSRDYYEQNETLREVLDYISSGAMTDGDSEVFRPLVQNLLESDPFFVLADYQSYLDAQERVSALWSDQEAWTRQSILNVARMGKFSSDRSILEYCLNIWNVSPICRQN